MFIIDTKHTPECSKLHYTKKNILQVACSRTPLATSRMITQWDVFHHLLFSKSIAPMFEHGFRSLIYIYVLKLIKFIIKLLCNLLGVQRYENIDAAHGAGWGKWVFGIANSATPLFSKTWTWWSNILNTYSWQ